MTNEIRRFSDEDRAAIRALCDRQTTAGKNIFRVSDQEFDELVIFCEEKQLNPLLKQVHFMPFFDKEKNKGTVSPHVSIEGLRLKAERTGRYVGQIGPEWCGEDGEWREAWTMHPTPPTACRVQVLRSDFTRPVSGVVMYSEFSQNTTQWKARPAHLLSVRAEAQAFRKAFPDELGGLYMAEEAAAARDEARESQPIERGVAEVEAESAKKLSAKEEKQERLLGIFFEWVDRLQAIPEKAELMRKVEGIKGDGPTGPLTRARDHYATKLALLKDAAEKEIGGSIAMSDEALQENMPDDDDNETNNETETSEQ